MATTNSTSWMTINETTIMVKESGDPWALDLNTLVTILFGIVGVVLQAGAMYYGRTQK